MKRVFLWLWLLTKRLYKKPTFLVMLLLIPLLSFGYQSATKGDSGIVTILLTQEGSDPIADAIIDKLSQGDNLLHFQTCENPEKATLLVQTGKADAAWIFPEDMLAHMDAFLEDPNESQPFIRVLQQEKNVSLMMSRERLSGELYHHMAQRFYLQYAREQFPELAELTDEALMVYYDGIEMTDTLFVYENIQQQEITQVHYLLAPVRGLLGVVITLSGLATAIYYIKDQKRGTFSWIPSRKMPAAELGFQLVSVYHISLVALIALALTGLSESIWLELPVLLLYPVCVAAFCMMLRSLVGSIRGIGSLLPVLIVLMILVCPVFFDLARMLQIQFLLPPTYYINAVYNPLYLAFMAGYTAINFGLYWLFTKVFKR